MLSRNPFRQGKTKYLLWNENPLFNISINPAQLKTHGGESFVRNLSHQDDRVLTACSAENAWGIIRAYLLHQDDRVLTIAVLLKAPIADTHKKWKAYPLTAN
eukprot:scaffold8717_cov87-Skeletonema_dohrnii-CCMP3373.AAC.3